MGILVTTCPVNGRKLETGIETDQASMRLTPPVKLRVQCPYCRVEHSISKHDAYVCELVDGVRKYLRAA